MRILSVDIPEKYIANGLESIKMDKLGQLVFLVGKNGAGKSRVLQSIYSMIQSRFKKSQYNSLDFSIKTAKHAILEYKRSAIAGIGLDVSDASVEKLDELSIEYEIDWRNDETVTFHQKRIDDYVLQLNQIEHDFVKTDSLHEVYKIIYFVPKNTFIQNPNALTKHGLMESADKISNVGVEHLSEGSGSRIQMIQDRWFNATHQNSTLPPAALQSAIDEYDNL